MQKEFLVSICGFVVSRSKSPPKTPTTQNALNTLKNNQDALTSVLPFSPRCAHRRKTWADAVRTAHETAPLTPITEKHAELRALYKEFKDFALAAVAEERFVARALLVLAA